MMMSVINFKEKISHYFGEMVLSKASTYTVYIVFEKYFSIDVSNFILIGLTSCTHLK